VNAGEKWRDLNSSLPWVKAFNDLVRNSPLPVLNGREVVIATDTSGLHRQSRFEVLGIVVFDFDSSTQWEILRQLVRREFLKDSRRMAFKKLDESVRQRALVPFLRAADQMHGLCLCVAVNKQIDMLGGGRLMFEQLKKESILKASWTFESFERMARTTQFVSLLIAGLCSEGQNVCWISDEDEMFESPEKSEDTLRLLTAFQRMNIKWRLGKLHAGTTKLDEGDRYEEDFAAIADLAAGAFAELVMKLKPNSDGCVIDASIDDMISDVSGKTDVLLSWLMDNTQALKRMSLIFDRRADGKFRVARL
jgi:hypothetical protein